MTKNLTVYVCVIDGEYATTATVHQTRRGALEAANDPCVFKWGADESLDLEQYESDDAREKALTAWYEENGSGQQYFEIVCTEVQDN